MARRYLIGQEIKVVQRVLHEYEGAYMENEEVADKHRRLTNRLLHLEAMQKSGQMYFDPDHLPEKCDYK